MTRLDWIIVGFTALTALTGFRRGLIRTVLSLVGLTAGAVVGARVAPHVLAGAARSEYAALIGLGGAVAGAVICQTAALAVGALLRSTLRLAPPLRLLDSVGGLAAGAAWGLTLAWVTGAVALQLPGHASWHREARQSHVLAHLNEYVPPRDVLQLRSRLSGSLRLGGR
jgi:uncharacterized membrane protein required for colicin V production